MAGAPFRLEGGRQVLDNLAELPKATQKNVLKRVLTKALEPIASNVKAKAPHLFGDLEKDLHIGVKLNKRQTALNKADKASTEVHFGTSDPAGMMNEFGNSRQAAQPFFRSEWEGGKHNALESIKRDLGSEIMAAVARRRR